MFRLWGILWAYYRITRSDEIIRLNCFMQVVLCLKVSITIVLDQSNWAQGIKVRPFRDKRPKQHRGNNNKSSRPRGNTNNYPREQYNSRYRDDNYRDPPSNERSYRDDRPDNRPPQRYSDERDRSSRDYRPDNRPSRHYSDERYDREPSRYQGTDIIGTPLDRTGITPIGNTSRGTAATPTGTNDNLHTTRIMSVNCYGLKSSFLTVIDWVKDTDILFLCESWLRPCEIPHIKSKLSGHNSLSYMKPSMDPELLQHGRPHGGVGFIL